MADQWDEAVEEYGEAEVEAVDEVLIQVAKQQQVLILLLLLLTVAAAASASAAINTGSCLCLYLSGFG